MLLQKKDYTEAELRRKLTEGEYPQEAVEEAVSYVKSFHYIDDERFCRAYINCYSVKWSRQQITTKLMTNTTPPSTSNHCIFLNFITKRH